MHIQENGNIKRVNKTVARKAFDAGADVYLLPHKVRFDNMWVSPSKIKKARNGDTFEKYVNAYIYYNCQYKELGTYPSFFTYK